MKESLKSLRSPDFEDRFLWGAEADGSVHLTLANILKERGTRGITLERKTRENDGGEYANIYILTDKTRTILSTIIKMPEMEALNNATYRDLAADEPEFEDMDGKSIVIVEEFKDENLQNRLKALFCKNKIAEFETWEDDGLEIWDDNSKAMNISHYAEEMEEYLRWSTPNSVPDGEEIKELIEAIVDSQGIPRKEKDVIEEVVIVDSKSTLRANEVADLDPYGVRSKGVRSAAQELLKKDREDKEDTFGEFRLASSDVMVVEELRNRGYDGIVINHLKNHSIDITILDEGVSALFEDLSKQPGLKLLSDVTNGFLHKDELNFQNVEFDEFRDPLVQKGLAALFFSTQMDEYMDFCNRTGKKINADVISDLATKREHVLGPAPSDVRLPNQEQIREWVQFLVEEYLIKK